MSRPAIPDLAWWRGDAERWELLEFDGQHAEDGLPMDARWEDRQQVLEALVRDPRQEDGNFARFLLLQETRWHGHSWGFSHSEIAAVSARTRCMTRAMTPPGVRPRCRSRSSCPTSEVKPSKARIMARVTSSASLRRGVMPTGGHHGARSGCSFSMSLVVA